mmetsp:Transcript_11807/g.16052  ORF Transcript_11807/g.16052 Transcript_11807/m.16052 type:complete len:110 (+) Transcript_11807:506-835(+)
MVILSLVIFTAAYDAASNDRLGLTVDLLQKVQLWRGVILLLRLGCLAHFFFIFAQLELINDVLLVVCVDRVVATQDFSFFLCEQICILLCDVARNGPLGLSRPLAVILS